MLDDSTMGRFIALPNGAFVVVNGGRNDTASYTQATGQTALFSNVAFANHTDRYQTGLIGSDCS